jgi:gliding motility-associated-like protein
MKYSNKGKPRLVWIFILMFLWSNGFYGQSSSLGDIYIQSGGEAVIHNIEHNFLLGSSSAQPGKILTERTGAKGYFSFLGTSSWTGANDELHIDGYARSYISGAFIFPIGQNGKYRPAAVKSASLTLPVDAAYYAANPSTIGVAASSNIRAISNMEYWDVNGANSTSLSLSWTPASGVASLTSSELTRLTIVGWNGLLWVEIPSTIDATSILGSASTLSSGSISSVNVVLDAYDFYTLAAKVSILKPKDTIITVLDTNVIVLGPAVLPDINVDYRLRGPFNGAGTASIDPKTGVFTFKPANPSFVGRDTIYKIRCVTNGAIVACDTVRIIIIGQPARKPVSDSTEFNKGKVLADLPPISTGGKPFTTTTSSSAGSTVTVDANGKVNYTPKPGFFGTDTVRIARCVGDICDIVTYIILVGDPQLVVVPNYISPNGDGKNDIWDLDALLDVYPQAKALIYNRWGNIVWRSTGPYGRSTSGANLWYGQLEGSQNAVPDGVYYYLLELDDDFKTTKTGFVELMRQ